MTSDPSLRPLAGDFSVVRTSGWAAALIRRGTRSSVNHATLCIGDGMQVEAQPGGAVISPVTRYPGAIWSTGQVTLSYPERLDIAAWGKSRVGTGYNWMDIAALSFAVVFTALFGRSRFTTAVLHVIAHRVENRHKLICSQLVDAAYAGSGLHLFDDDRLPGQVTPGDLLGVIQTKGSSIRRDDPRWPQ